MDSPIIKLLGTITSSIINIAPEKKADIEKFINENEIKIVYTDEIGFVFKANTKTKTVKASIKGLEHLWCSSYAYYIIYQKSIASMNNGDKYLSFDSDEKTKIAKDLLVWSIENVNSLNKKEWPINYPIPPSYPILEDDALYASDVHVASEIFLCSVAWILHHELQHIKLGHQPVTVNSISEEKDADKKAVQWILNGVTDEFMIQKRALGITIAILVLTSFEIGDFKIDAKTHPKAFERIYYCLNNPSLDENHIVYFFASLMLKVHMDAEKINIPTKQYDSARECFDDYCLFLFRLK